MAKRVRPRRVCVCCNVETCRLRALVYQCSCVCAFQMFEFFNQTPRKKSYLGQNRVPQSKNQWSKNVTSAFVFVRAFEMFEFWKQTLGLKQSLGQKSRAPSDVTTATAEAPRPSRAALCLRHNRGVVVNCRRLTPQFLCR